MIKHECLMSSQYHAAVLYRAVIQPLSFSIQRTHEHVSATS